MDHRWDLTFAEARVLQNDLASQVVVDVPLPPWNRLAAADVSFNRGSKRLFAAVVVFDRGTSHPVEQVSTWLDVDFPYVSGFLSFREAPVLLNAFALLKNSFDLVLCDGQGIAHPRRLGIACHLGLWLDKPTIGCAKSRLCGEADEPGPNRGDWTPLFDRGELVGRVVRTKKKVKPLYISPGHRCDLEGAMSVVMELSGKYRLPQPIRRAHDFVNECRRRSMREEET